MSMGDAGLDIIQQIDITSPDDWHLHIRDGDIMASILPSTFKWASRAIIMPNLVPPITTHDMAIAYRERIKALIPDTNAFEPLLTLYLTEHTQPNDVLEAFAAGVISAVKLYPAGATTNSQNGVTDLSHVYPVLEAMAAAGIPLLIHGEVTDAKIDIFDREAVFIDTVLDPLRHRLPELLIVMEHITTKQAADYIVAAEHGLAATITPHHLMMNRNAILAGGIRPPYYCLPVLKRERHRLALVSAATSGDRRFFLGTDSAPHLDANKLEACGCAGIFNAPNTMELIAQVFDDEGALDKMEAFTSLNGPAFYQLPVNSGRLKLVKKTTPLVIQPEVKTSDGGVTVFNPGRPIYWHLEQSDD